MANSKIYLGNTNIGSLFQGADDISIYLGANKVYPLEEPPFQGKWKATYQDSHVESAQCGSSSAIVENEINKTNLVSVEIGDCVTFIDNAAFQYCTSLTSINIPNSVTSIGDSAFEYCSSLTSIDIPSGVTSIGYSAFRGCTSLTSAVINSNAAVGVLRHNTAIKVIILGDSVTSIDEYAFQDCRSLEYIDMPKTVTSIRQAAFQYCSSLTKIDIPDSVTSIGNNAFQECSGLEYIDIPDSVTSIGNDAFSYCTGLTTCRIGSGVTRISNNAFFNCSSLTIITVEATTPPMLDFGAFDNTNNCPIYVPGESLYMYMTASGWSNYSSRLQAIY